MFMRHSDKPGVVCSETLFHWCGGQEIRVVAWQPDYAWFLPSPGLLLNFFSLSPMEVYPSLGIFWDPRELLLVWLL